MDPLTSLTQCPVCLEQFDSKTRIAKFIPSCSHTLCEICLAGILSTQNPPKCPNCRKVLSQQINEAKNFPTNLTMLEVIHLQKCRVHNCIQDLICMHEYEEICEKCMLTKHEGHKVITKEEFRRMTKEKISQLDEIKEKLCKPIETLTNTMTDIQEDILKEAAFNFQDLHTLMKKKEEEICLNVKKGFEEEMTKDYQMKMAKALEDLKYNYILLTQQRVCKSTLDALKMNLSVPNIEEMSVQQDYFIRRIKESTNQQIQMVIESLISLFPTEDNIESAFSANGGDVIRKRITQVRNNPLYDNFIFEDKENKLAIRTKYCKNDLCFQVLVHALRHIYKDILENERDPELCSELLRNCWPGIFSLSLDFTHSFMITDYALKVIGQCLAQILPYLKALTFKFHSSNSITDEGVRILSEALEAQNNIDALNLYFTRSNKITNDGIDVLSKALAKFASRLEVLTLYFGGCKQITHEGIEAFSVAFLSQSLKLRQLTLNFWQNGEINDKGVACISNVVKSTLTTLEDLTLNYSWSRNITDSGLLTISEIFEKDCSTLKSIKLGFGYECTDVGVDRIFQKLFRGASNLESLDFYFYDAKHITDLSLGIISDGLKNQLSKLQNLILSFRKCQNISDQGISELNTALENILPKLHHLELRFSSSKITSEGVDGLNRALNKPLPQLETLGLNFEGEHQVTDVQLNSLTKSIDQGNFSGVKHFHLCYNESGLITEQGVEEFINALCKANLNMENLTLCFNEGTLISDEKYDQLKNLIKTKYPNLRSFLFENYDVPVDSYMYSDDSEFEYCENHAY